LISGRKASISRRDFLTLSGIVTLAYGMRPSSLGKGHEQVKMPDRSQKPPLTLGLYIPFKKINHADTLEGFKVLVLLSGANTIVVDIKNEWGLTHVPFEHRFKPSSKFVEENPEALSDLISWCNRNEVYLIGRQVVMSDGKLTSAYPWLGLKHTNGGLWRDLQGIPWSNPLREEVADYNATIAQAAASMGIPEIQYDYVRFPSDDSPTQYLFYEMKNTFEQRTTAITNILRQAQAAVHAVGSLLAADVFCYTAWRSFGDMGIGQHLETLGPFVDVLSPMAYPSLFGTKLPASDPCPNGCFPGSAYPYEVVNYTVRHSIERLVSVNPNILLVPWIQAYPDARFQQRMSLVEFEEQQRGALEAGARGVLAWNPSLRYDPNFYQWIKERERQQESLFESLAPRRIEW
jgi:hypothetical protein